MSESVSVPAELVEAEACQNWVTPGFRAARGEEA